MDTVTKSTSIIRTFSASKRRHPAAAVSNKKKKKQAHDTTCTPHKPFGLSKHEITTLKKSIEASHQSFTKDWTHQVLSSTNPHVVDIRKQTRNDFSKVSREISIKQIGLFGTARNMLSGKPLYTRTEQDGIREATDELLIANAVWSYESMAKKALYEFPIVYSRILDEIFNQNLFASDKMNDNYLVESGAISPQLARALAEQSNTLKDGGIATRVKVRTEASSPVIVGYSSRFQTILLHGDNPLPSTLSLLHNPGGGVRFSELPLEYESTTSVCVHVMLHTHETYAFTTRQDEAGKLQKSTTNSTTTAKLNTPRILTFNGHTDFSFHGVPSKEGEQTFKHEVDLAVMEDRQYDLFAHNPAKYKKVYPDGNPMSDNLGIQWQLVDIDFLVARSQGWVTFDKKTGFQIKERFCYQPPVGYLDYDKEDAEKGQTHDERFRGDRFPWKRIFAKTVVALLEILLLILLMELFLLGELP